MSEKKKQHGAGQLLPLFVSFLKIGAFTFGGGYAMIPLIQKEAADRHKWMTDEEIDRESTRLNSSHIEESRMPSSA